MSFQYQCAILICKNNNYFQQLQCFFLPFVLLLSFMYFEFNLAQETFLFSLKVQQEKRFDNESEKQEGGLWRV